VKYSQTRIFSVNNACKVRQNESVCIFFRFMNKCIIISKWPGVNDYKSAALMWLEVVLTSGLGGKWVAVMRYHQRAFRWRRRERVKPQSCRLISLHCWSVAGTSWTEPSPGTAYHLMPQQENMHDLKCSCTDYNGNNLVFSFNHLHLVLLRLRLRLRLKGWPKKYFCYHFLI